MLDGVWQTHREHAARARLGPVVLRAWQPSVAAGLAVLVASLAGAVVLERALGRFAFRPAAALAGLVLAAGGVGLHGWARRTLGPMWSGVVQVRAQHALVEHGPYRLVRHPIYLAGLLLAAGVVLKAWLEEHALRGVLGEEYTRYAARVPALIPWPRTPRHLRRAVSGTPR